MPHGQGMPPALNIIALATFAASLSARALDPVLPHVADDFGVSIATAAGFASVFAFTFAIVQPVLGAAADLFGKARLMVVCLVLLGLASILGAMANSFSLLFASRILAGIGSGGVFPIALGLTSDLVSPEKRQVAIGRTLAGAMTGNLLGASASGLIGDFLGWRGVLAVLGGLVILASVAVAVGFRGAALTRPPRTNMSALKHGYRTIFRQSQCAGLLFRRLHRRLLRARLVSVHRRIPVRSRRNQPVDRRDRHCRLRGRRPVLHHDRVAVPAAASRQRHDDRGRGAGRPATGYRRLRPELENPGDQPFVHGLGFLHAARLAAGICQRTVGGSPPPRCRCIRSSFSWARPSVRSPTGSAS